MLEKVVSDQDPGIPHRDGEISNCVNGTESDAQACSGGAGGQVYVDHVSESYTEGFS